MAIYEQFYSELNAQQKEAVDTIDGPVLVIAGPGTGKTQLLSMRVANILRKTDTDPSGILCLTFTNKAAVNMKERLIRLTDGEARDVMVKTFHSFATELMNMYPDYFWNGARLSTAPDAVQTEIILEILSSLPLDNPLALRFAGTFTAGNDVKDALKNVKEAGLTPEKLQAIIEANVSYIDVIEQDLVAILSKPLRASKLAELRDAVHALPNQGVSGTLMPLKDLGIVIKEKLDFAISQDEGTNKTKHVGKWKKEFVQNIEGVRAMHDQRKYNAWWLALVGVYEMYREALHSRGHYDYSDMLVEVITQLQNHAAMRADVQERFQYVLIDEFQDSNAAQLQLAHLISNHYANEGSPNLMAVGDDDQSIYKFNGAELNNMLSFETSYPTTKRIVLEDNYRSSQKVLDSARSIIELAGDRLVLRDASMRKELVARNAPLQKGNLVHHSYPTQEDELSGIARLVAHEYRAGAHDIAILASHHDSLERIAGILVSLKIPIAYERQSNILTYPVIIQIHLITSLLMAIQHGDSRRVTALLSETLRAPMWGLDPKALWDLAVANQRGASWLDGMLTSAHKPLQDIAQWLLWLSSLSMHESLLVTIEHVLGLASSEEFTSPVRTYFMESTSKDSDYLHGLSAIRILLGMVHEFARTNSGTLKDFVAFIQLSIDTGEIIADESNFVSGENAVQLMSVHKAKGLEFESVYIVDAIEKQWQPSSRGRKAPANVPLKPDGDNGDDFVRLMYVAVTRAKRNVYAASFREDIKGADVLASPLIYDALSLRVHERKNIENPIAILEEHLTWPHLNDTDEKRVLHSILENYALSATGLLDFLDVSNGGPETFFARHILRLPSVTTTNMAFGTAIHAALEYAQIATNTDSLSKAKVIGVYEKSLLDQQLSLAEEQRFLDHGRLLIEKLLASETFWIGKGGIPEQKITDVTIGNARLNGTIDRIDKTKNTVTIVDYKTGKPLSSFDTKNTALQLKAWRHKMQLIFYAMLLKHSPRFKASDIRGQMWYVEASSAKELIREYIPTEEDIARMEKLTVVIWKHVINLSLPDISGYTSDYAGVISFQEDLLQ
jgi:DNA helicase-2/ATP-dependent DNA helicase PcrA